MTWRDSAACLGTWHLLPWTNPAHATSDQLARMLDFCASCTVLDECEADMHQRGDWVGVRAGQVWVDEPRRRGRPRKFVRCVCGRVTLLSAGNQRFCSQQCRERYGWRSRAS